MKQIDKLKEAIKDLYLSVAKLRSAFKERPFTPDGRLVGDIGEAIAALKFAVILDSKIKKHWDGYWVDSNKKEHKVQVRATQQEEKGSTYLKEPPHDGTFLVFKITPDGEYETVFNGSIMRVWNKIKNQRSKEKTISLKDIRKLNREIDAEKIKANRHL